MTYVVYGEDENFYKWLKESDYVKHNIEEVVWVNKDGEFTKEKKFVSKITITPEIYEEYLASIKP